MYYIANIMVADAPIALNHQIITSSHGEIFPSLSVYSFDDIVRLILS